MYGLLPVYGCSASARGVLGCVSQTHLLERKPQVQAACPGVAVSRAGLSEEPQIIRVAVVVLAIGRGERGAEHQAREEREPEVRARYPAERDGHCGAALASKPSSPLSA